MCPLKSFCRSTYHCCPGEHVPYVEFQADFHVWLAEHGHDPANWPRSRIVDDLPRGVVYGYGAGNVRTLGNLSKTFSRPRRFVRVGNRVRLERPAVA